MCVSVSEIINEKPVLRYSFYLGSRMEACLLLEMHIPWPHSGHVI